MYKYKEGNRTLIRKRVLIEGETIEKKVKRMIENKEPIKDGSPLIFTERKDGVMAAYNIRTDRWEIAADAMDKITASKRAKTEEVVKPPEGKVIEMKPDGKPESTHGKTESK